MKIIIPPRVHDMCEEIEMEMMAWYASLDIPFKNEVPEASSNMSD